MGNVRPISDYEWMGLAGAMAWTTAPQKNLVTFRRGGETDATDLVPYKTPRPLGMRPLMKDVKLVWKGELVDATFCACAEGTELHWFHDAGDEGWTLQGRCYEDGEWSWEEAWEFMEKLPEVLTVELAKDYDFDELVQTY